jgi:hypothetical protein
MIEKLYCEIGDHHWERESKRGRKPSSCSEHLPIPAPKSAAELNEAGERKLVCQEGNHEFWAPVQRGRPPKFCPEHRFVPVKAILIGSEPHILMSTAGPSVDIESVIDATPATVETWCKGGQHHYQRERKRGKSPLSCPEHSVIGAIERKRELEQQKKEKAQKALQESIEGLSARVQAAEVVDQDAMAKLIAAGGADSADEETFKQWLRANSVLLHEVEALRSRERKLSEL